MANVSPTFALAHPQAAPVKAKVSIARWRQIVRAAHAGGYTVDSYVDPNTPPALKARTQAGLRKQALTTINAAYAPAETELNSRQTRIQAIDRQRASDNQYYNDWLKSKSDTLNATINAHNSTLVTAGNQMHQATVDAYKQAHDNLVQGAEQTPGAIPGQGMEGAKAFDLSAQQQRGLGMVDTVRQQGLSSLAEAGAQQGFAQGQNVAEIAAAEARRQQDTNTALTGVFSDKEKLTLSKAADAAKEFARLLDNETTKAQNNRDYQTAAAQLNIKQDTLKLAGAKFKQNARIQNADLTLAQSKQAHIQHMDEFNRWLARQKLDVAQQNANTSWYRATHNGKKPAVNPHATTRRAFDAAYAYVGGLTRGKKQAPLNTKYVQQNHDHFVSLVMAKTGVNRNVAEAAVGSYETYKGGDPWNTGLPDPSTPLGKALNKIQKIVGPAAAPQ